VLASLEDPNVVRLYEYVESPSGAAIVMELVGGVSLREILTYQGKTTAEAALVVLQGSLLGLAAAHRRGVVHRDYKPENVLVNGDGVSKLTDFGIAARTGDRPVPAGTLAYAAPEQMAGAPASPASDVYAATATFYECLTGRPPFSGETAAELIRQHHSEPVPLEPVPEPLRPLVTAGMAKDPGQPADRRAHLRRRAQDGRIPRLRPALGGSWPLAPRRGGAPAGGPVAVRRAARGSRHRRAPDFPAPSGQAPAFQRGQGRRRGRLRDRGRGGRGGSGRRRARGPAPQATRSHPCDQSRSPLRRPYSPRRGLRPRRPGRRGRPRISSSGSSPTQTGSSGSSPTQTGSSGSSPTQTGSSGPSPTQTGVVGVLAHPEG
jgi:eukaryotic-like serine/threonine-protein kinase